MSDLVHIKYGNFDFTKNNLFVPYLSRDQEFVSYKGKFGQITKITLDGNIGGTYKQIDDQRSLILEAFLNDFKDLTVREFAGLDNGDENLGLIIKFERCIIKSVNFSAVNSGITNYQIELECIEKSLFAHSYGILNPKNEYSFSELENGFIQISHSISAEGIAANGKSAMANAKNFVESKKGYDIKTISPSLAPFTGGLNVGSFSIILTETSINVNVVNSEYSIEETFLVHSDNNAAAATTRIDDVVSTSSCSFEKSIQGDFFSVKVDFSIQGGKDTTEDILRSKIPSSSELYRAASLAATGFVLNPIPTAFDVFDEAATSQKIKINASYDTNSISFADKFLTVDQQQVYTSSGGVYFDYSVDFSTDYITDVTTVKISGEVIARDNIINKYQKIKTFYEQKVLPLGVSNYLYYLAKNSYEKNMSFPWKLNPNGQSFDSTENRNKGTISLSSSFTNKDYLPGCYQAKYSVSVSPRIKKYHSVASCNENGLYGVFDINQVTTEEININGSIQNKKNQTKVELLNSYSYLMNNIKLNLVNNQILFKEPTIGTPIITKESLTIGETPTLNINFSHSFKVDSFYIMTD